MATSGNKSKLSERIKNILRFKRRKKISKVEPKVEILD